jgi:hypothetical protein
MPFFMAFSIGLFSVVFRLVADGAPAGEEASNGAHAPPHSYTEEIISSTLGFPSEVEVYPPDRPVSFSIGARCVVVIVDSWPAETHRYVKLV